jgi:hypothetical protein
LDERIVDTFVPVLATAWVWISERIKRLDTALQKADATVFANTIFLLFRFRAFWSYRATAFDCAGMSHEVPGTASLVLLMTAGCG